MSTKVIFWTCLFVDERIADEKAKKGNFDTAIWAKFWFELDEGERWSRIFDKFIAVWYFKSPNNESN